MRLSLQAKKGDAQRECWASLPTSGFFIESEREVGDAVVMTCVVDPGHYRTIINTMTSRNGQNTFGALLEDVRVEVLNLAVTGDAASAAASIPAAGHGADGDAKGNGGGVGGKAAVAGWSKWNQGGEYGDEEMEVAGAQKKKKKKKKKRRRARNQQQQQHDERLGEIEAQVVEEERTSVGANNMKRAAAVAATAAATGATAGVGMRSVDEEGDLATGDGVAAAAASAAAAGGGAGGVEDAKFKCSKCPGAGFTESVDFRAHFRSDWHRYNLKAKIRGLPAVDGTAFACMTAEEVAAVMAKDL